MVLGANLFAAAPVSAQVDVIDDVRQCRLVTAVPSLSNYEITGFGGSTDACTRVPGFLGTEVCVDYNLITVATSCRLYPAGATGATNPVPCLPGTWFTQVTPVGIFGPEGDHTHSFPLVVTTQPCVRR